MGRGAKTVEAKFLAVARDSQRAPSDQSCAEQRRKRFIAAVFTDWGRKARVGDRNGRKTAVACMAGKERTIEIFAVFDAIGTDTARMAEPGGRRRARPAVTPRPRFRERRRGRRFHGRE